MILLHYNEDKDAMTMKKYIIFLFSFYSLLGCFQAKLSQFDIRSAGGRLSAFALIGKTNHPPIIKSFTYDTKEVTIDTKIFVQWEVEDPDGDKVTCYLDLDSDGKPEATIENCATQSGEYSVSRTGFLYPSLTATDGKVQSENKSTESLHSQLAGGLDPNFSLQLTNSDLIVFDILEQPDEKILLAGTISAANSEGFLARFLPDGSPDGFVSMANSILATLALQSDGKILLGGTCTGGLYCISRYNSDLSLDASFGTNGVKTGTLKQIWEEQIKLGLFMLSMMKRSLPRVR